jgi:hypothetical protein
VGTNVSIFRDEGSRMRMRSGSLECGKEYGHLIHTQVRVLPGSVGMVNTKCDKNCIQGVMEIDIHPNTMNKKGGFTLHKSWKLPPIYSLKELKRTPLLPISLLQWPFSQLVQCDKNSIVLRTGFLTFPVDPTWA